ncbi:hypothetical protein EGW08_018318 [Elysia chlorotica]|uniref:Uncharacterized protein n=1 Tax=Elysia chlorotica TaxID=188477 RepID=A0A433SXD3_ELYCH|nr:hypothetical protein EGW08_018318 [Elysia chlorotica]
MKVAALLVFTAVFSAACGAAIEKRQLDDYFDAFAAIGQNTLSDLLDLANRGWADLKQKIKDYDIHTRYNQIKDKLVAKYGGVFQTISTFSFDTIADAVTNVLANAVGLQDIASIVKKVRAVLGKDADSVDDTELGEIVKEVEDDITSGGDDAVAKRAIFDTFGGIYRNLTAIGRNAYSDLFNLARQGWNDLKQKIQDYDIKGRIATIRQKATDRYGPIFDKISSLRFEHIVDEAKKVISTAADILDVKAVVGQIRAGLGAEVEDIPDEEIEDIIKVVEEDVISEPVPTPSMI